MPNKANAAEHVNGIEFGDLAAEYSECPSAQDGGDLGEFGRLLMELEFEADALESVGEGQAPDAAPDDGDAHRP